MIVIYVSYFIWFILLVIWNYCYPEANPLEDVLAGIFLAIILAILKKKLNFLKKFKND